MVVTTHLLLQALHRVSEWVGTAGVRLRAALGVLRVQLPPIIVNQLTHIHYTTHFDTVWYRTGPSITHVLGLQWNGAVEEDLKYDEASSTKLYEDYYEHNAWMEDL